ncbi:hypothetical protein [uncultured Roseivirga sp.]|uniref:hypothetical protein n=1 Tax=uncultured Roseivirga sp. TaxID=543088 RepID=UPI0030DCCF17|tara:strand:- start:32657 stop:32872 length:216 start_codon:yes stop_codon:yes gene_type:complete
MTPIIINPIAIATAWVLNSQDDFSYGFIHTLIKRVIPTAMHAKPKRTFILAVTFDPSHYIPLKEVSSFLGG